MQGRGVHVQRAGAVGGLFIGYSCCGLERAWDELPERSIEAFPFRMTRDPRDERARLRRRLSHVVSVDVGCAASRPLDACTRAVPRAGWRKRSAVRSAPSTWPCDLLFIASVG